MRCHIYNSLQTRWISLSIFFFTYLFLFSFFNLSVQNQLFARKTRARSLLKKKKQKKKCRKCFSLRARDVFVSHEIQSTFVMFNKNKKKHEKRAAYADDTIKISLHESLCVYVQQITRRREKLNRIHFQIVVDLPTDRIFTFASFISIFAVLPYNLYCLLAIIRMQNDSRFCWFFSGFVFFFASTSSSFSRVVLNFKC